MLPSTNPPPTTTPVVPPPPASTATPTQSIPADVGDFWNPHTPWVSGTPFLFRTFTKEPPVSFFQRNEGLGRELFFFFSLLGIGSLIVGYHWTLIDEREFLASMFFASGFIPSIQLLIFEVLPKQFQNKKKRNRPPPPESSRHLDNLLSVGLSAFFLSVAMVLYPSPDDEQDEWGIVCGKTLFEAGLIYFVTRVLFFVPNPNDEVRELRDEVLRLKQSMAMGLADGYFWNLVQEIAIDIRDANGPQGTLKLTFPRQGEEWKRVKRFYILIPRHLDFTKEDPIKELISDCKDAGHFKDCKIEKSPKRAESTRVKWVTDVVLNPSQTPVAVSTSSPHQDGILIDIPTTMTALLMNLRADSQASGNNNINREVFQAEVSSFAYRLAWQLKRQQLEDYVAVVEMENSLDLIDKIRDIHLQAKTTP